MINIAIEAVKAASEILLDNFGKIVSEDIKEKNRNDFLTFVDTQAEKTIIKILLDNFPDHSILAEESGWQKQNSEFQWIIDPLDGTKNYISGVPNFSISIACRKNEDIILGVILDPVRDEEFTAVRNEGAYLNGSKLQVSQQMSMEKCLIGTGFPFKLKEFLPKYMKTFEDIFSRTSGIRRLGSAAIDLAYVAAGRFDGFWELGLSPWDMPAGSLMIEEAGGKTSDFWGEDFYLDSGYIVATNGHIHQKLIEITGSHFNKND
jgi:myo-inositol-1(or 4)-monophosphatase